MLVDVDFMLSVQSYVNSLYENTLNPEKHELIRDAMQSIKDAGRKCDKVKFELAESTVTEGIRRGFKLQGTVEKLAIALLDPNQSVEEVVILQVSKCRTCIAVPKMILFISLQTDVFANLSRENIRQQTHLSLRLDGLSITSSHLLKLDSPTSHVSRIISNCCHGNCDDVITVSATSRSQCCL